MLRHNIDGRPSGRPCFPTMITEHPSPNPCHDAKLGCIIRPVRWAINQVFIQAPAKRRSAQHDDPRTLRNQE